MVIFQGLFYLGPAALLFCGCFKRPFLERLTHCLPSPYLFPSDQLICLMLSPQRQQKAKISAEQPLSLLVIGRSSLNLQVGSSEFPGYSTSPKLDRAAFSCRPENFLGLKYSRPTGFSNMSCSPTLLDCHCIQ